MSEDLHHMLAVCPSLRFTRDGLHKFTIEYVNTVPIIRDITVKYLLLQNEQFTQFLVDCSCLPEVIRLYQSEGPWVLHHFYRVSRTWCYTLHRARLQILGRWSNL